MVKGSLFSKRAPCRYRKAGGEWDRRSCRGWDVMRTWEEGLLLERRRGEPQSGWKEGSMWEERREGRIIKEERRKRRNLEVMASMCSVNLESAKSL